MTNTQPPKEWLAAPPVLDDISTADGWNRYVAHRNDYRAPALLSRDEYNALPPAHRTLYDYARQIAVANLPKHDTPMAVNLQAQVIPTLRVNTLNASPGVRTGLMVSAEAGLGKSTLVREIAATFDEQQRMLATIYPNAAGNRDSWLPVAWVNVPSNATIKGLCAEILAFYGETPKTKHASQDALTARVKDLVVACGTRLIVLDDITRLKMWREADQDASDWVRKLMETAATILGVGVDVEKSGLLYEGQASARSKVLLTQTRRRFTVHNLHAFTDETGDAFTGWLAHLRAIENDLPLLDKAPGMLTGGDTPAYLLRRTNGVIGTLTRLIAEASVRVIGQTPTGPETGEYLNRAVLASVTLDHAAEYHEATQTEVSPRATRTVPRARNSAFSGNRTRRRTA